MKEGYLAVLLPQHKEDLIGAGRGKCMLISKEISKYDQKALENIRTELTVSMSSIILENQKSQATCTIWVGEGGTSIRFEQSSAENLKASNKKPMTFLDSARVE